MVGAFHPHFHLDRRLLPVCFGRDFLDKTVIFPIRTVGVGGDGTRLPRAELRKIVLIDIQLHLEIVQIGHRYDIAFGALVADEAGGDEFTLLDISFENGSIDRRANDGVVLLHLGVGQGPLELIDLGSQGIDLFLPGTEPDQFGSPIEGCRLSDRGVVTRLSVVERLFRHHAFPDQLLGAIQVDLGIDHVGAGLFEIGFRLGDFCGPRAVLRFSQASLEGRQLALGL